VVVIVVVAIRPEKKAGKQPAFSSQASAVARPR
jgi:hypothetical protein